MIANRAGCARARITTGSEMVIRCRDVTPVVSHPAGQPTRVGHSVTPVHSRLARGLFCPDTERYLTHASLPG
jgi:hypothetical protein